VNDVTRVLHNDVTRDLHSDEWRKALNRAVLEFGAAAGRSDVQLSDAVKGMLREIGHALAVDRVALIEYSTGTPVTSGHSWHWSADLGEEPVLLPLVERVELEGDPTVVYANPQKGITDVHTVSARAYLERTAVRSAAVIPIAPTAGPPSCVLVLGTVRESFEWTDGVLEHLHVLGEIVAHALQSRREPLARVQSRASTAPLTPPEDQGMSAGESSKWLRGFDGIVGESASLKAALNRLEEVAKTESTVLLLGETGTGKELFARAIHARSPRRAYPIVSVNCGALPPTLIESELFGHQRGAFTGAVELRQGRFELAHRGTLFLDEIGDLPPEVQVKLLRVLQEGVFERVGSSRSHSVDVRIIAATHRDLDRAVADGEFRADLYYRLNVFPIRLPPLRERREDIPALVWAIIRKRQRAIHRQIKTVPPELMEMLKRHSWPGNIRELENIVERALIHSPGDTLQLLDWTPESVNASPDEGGTLKSVERAHIQEVLRECNWKINGLGNAAERLGLHPNTLRFRMKKLGIIRHPSIRHQGGTRATSESDAGDRAS
jgi:formate hydrogenlyase transcriptional activator